MDQLRAIRYFSKVAETGSFTKAASAFAVQPSSLSRRVADLEKHLGATLLKRSTRVVKLTEVAPKCFSRSATLRDRDEGGTAKALAALVKLPVSATLLK